jgi:hypothetical protein
VGVETQGSERVFKNLNRSPNPSSYTERGENTCGKPFSLRVKGENRIAKSLSMRERDTG